MGVFLSLSRSGPFVRNIIILGGPVTNLISHKTMDELHGLGGCCTLVVFPSAFYGVVNFIQRRLIEVRKVNLLSPINTNLHHPANNLNSAAPMAKTTTRQASPRFLAEMRELTTNVQHLPSRPIGPELR